MTIMDYVTLGTAITGAILGIINTYNRYSDKRLRLRVVPMIGIMRGSRAILTTDRDVSRVQQLFRESIPHRLCIRVTNLSIFPVTIAEVGIGRLEEARSSFYDPEITPPGRKMPARLEPRESITAYAAIGDTPCGESMRPPVAYARTDCGHVRYGKSPVLTQYVMELKERGVAG